MDCDCGDTTSHTRLVSLQSESQLIVVMVHAYKKLFSTLLEIQRHPISRAKRTAKSGGDYLEFHCSLYGAGFVLSHLVF